MSKKDNNMNLKRNCKLIKDSQLYDILQKKIKQEKDQELLKSENKID